jgi:hypothetical protein
MQTPRNPPESATRARDAAAARLRRLTVGAFAGASVLAVAFSGVAAATTHARKAVARTRTVTAATLPAVHVSAPSPIPPGGAEAAAAPAAPLQTPTPAYSQPVVTSGGS